MNTSHGANVHETFCIRDLTDFSQIEFVRKNNSDSLLIEIKSMIDSCINVVLRFIAFRTNTSDVKLEKLHHPTGSRIMPLPGLQS